MKKTLLFLKNEAGSIAVLAAFMLPVIMGMAGVGVDVSYWMMQRQSLQTAADSAAVSVALEIVKGNTDDLDAIARDEAERNGWSEGVHGEIDVVYDSEADTVTVGIDQDADTFFAGYFIDDVTVGVQARASISGNGGEFCVLALDEDDPGALTVSGNVDISMPDCGFAINSNAEDAFALNGNYDVAVADVTTAGGVEETGGSGSLVYDSLTTNAATVSDPLADFEVPAFTGCSPASMGATTRYTRNTTLNPGVICGNLTVTGNNTITLNPGVYIIDGGSLNISGNGALNGTGVTIILTNSTGGVSGSYGSFSITGGKDVNLSAPTSGATAGVALYVDRDAPTTGTNSILGNSDVEVDGAIYTPSQSLNFGGNRNIGSDICTHVIGRTLTLHGNPYMGNNCSDEHDVNVTAPSSVRLSG